MKRKIKISWSKGAGEHMNIDFGAFESKDKIIVSENEWQEYVILREAFERMQKNLVDKIRKVGT